MKQLMKLYFIFIANLLWIDCCPIDSDETNKPVPTQETETTIPIFYNHSLETSSPDAHNSKAFAIGPQMGLVLGRLCSFDSRTDSPKIHIYTPDKCEVMAIVCNKKISQLKPKALKYCNWATKTNKSRFFAPNNTSKEQSLLLAWEYKNQIPMWWKLRCAHDLRDLINYLKLCFQEMEVAPIHTNQLLITMERTDNALPFLIPQKSSSCTLLSKDESEFLHEHFTVIDQADQAKKIVNINEKMLSQLTKLKLLDIAEHDEGPIISTLKLIYSKTSLKDLLFVILFYKIFCIIREFRSEILKTARTFSHHASFDELVERALKIKENRDKVLEFTGNLGTAGGSKQSSRKKCRRFSSIVPPPAAESHVAPPPSPPSPPKES